MAAAARRARDAVELTTVAQLRLDNEKLKTFGDWAYEFKDGDCLDLNVHTNYFRGGHRL